MNGEDKTADGSVAARLSSVSSVTTRLLKEADLRALLGIKERKFKELRAAGVICDPIELGARSPRWTWQDYLQILENLPRRPRAPEPVALAQGRLARKAAAGATTASPGPGPS